MAYAFAEGAVTRLRREFKLLLPPQVATDLCRRLGRQTRPTRTEITSIYFDRAGHPLTLRALRTPEDCLKVRLKEYAPDLGCADPRVVVEVKRERDGLTQKQRAWVSRKELRALYESGELWGRVPFSDAAGLHPVLGVTYVRDVYQLSEAWRVTVDQGVAFHRVKPVQVLGPKAVGLEGLDAPVSRADGMVVEVKHLNDELPAWLAELRANATVKFSKFATGMTRLGLGTGEAEVAVVGG